MKAEACRVPTKRVLARQIALRAQSIAVGWTQVVDLDHNGLGSTEWGVVGVRVCQRSQLEA